MAKVEESVSCVVPVFNQAQYLSATLDSIFAQTVPVTEVIVVDDGSTDNIDQVINSYPNQLTVLKQENAGPAAARNAGIRVASGDWLTFLDSDDLWDENKLELQLALMRANPELDYCLSFKRNFWESSMATEEAKLRALNHPMTKLIPGYVFQCMLIYKTTFEKVGYLNEALRVAEDTDWFARAEDMGMQREIHPQVLVNRRMHTANISYQSESDLGYKAREVLLMEHILRRKKAKKDGQQKK